jgi:Mandelate racemase / muconate lactonizing enzyme, C-terminal domain.
MKVKVGENLKEDIEAMTEIAKLKSEMRFIIDANMGYTPKEAVFFIKEMYKQG